MSDVQVRQWSDHVFAAYVFGGDRFGTFVGTESTRDAARELGESRCGTTVSAGVSDVSETERMGELGCARREWPDILVEILSDRDRKIPGWANPRKRLSCDYIGYAFIPSQTCHLIPYRELRRIMAHGPGRDWWREAARKLQDGERGGIQFVDARNPRDKNRPVRYWTRSLAVPTKLLLAEIAKSLTFTWAAAEPAKPKDEPEEDWPPVPPIPDWRAA